jgi:hypothetical protein
LLEDLKLKNELEIEDLRLELVSNNTKSVMSTLMSSNTSTTRANLCNLSLVKREYDKREDFFRYMREENIWTEKKNKNVSLAELHRHLMKECDNEEKNPFHVLEECQHEQYQHFLEIQDLEKQIQKESMEAQILEKCIKETTPETERMEKETFQGLQSNIEKTNRSIETSQDRTKKLSNEIVSMKSEISSLVKMLTTAGNNKTVINNNDVSENIDTIENMLRRLGLIDGSAK